MGEIRISVKFPGVSSYISLGLEGIEKPEGGVLLAELVAEAFCKAVAIKGIEQGKFNVLGDPVEAYNRTVSDIQKRHMNRIHQLVNVWIKQNKSNLENL